MLWELVHEHNEMEHFKSGLFIQVCLLLFSSQKDKTLSVLCFSVLSAEIVLSHLASMLEWDPFWTSGVALSEILTRICSTGEIAKFLASVSGLAYAEKPKYQVLKKILLDGLESSGMCYDGPLEFSAAAASARNHFAAKAPRVSETALGAFLTVPASCLPSWRGGSS